MRIASVFALVLLLPACTPEVCGDGIDNDSDGATDCCDLECADTSAGTCLSGVCVQPGDDDDAVDDDDTADDDDSTDAPDDDDTANDDDSTNAPNDDDTADDDDAAPACSDSSMFPPVDATDDDDATFDPPNLDDDGDGVPIFGPDGIPANEDDDCDDNDPARAPGLPDLVDAIDNDCDGHLAEATSEIPCADVHRSGQYPGPGPTSPPTPVCSYGGALGSSSRPIIHDGLVLFGTADGPVALDLDDCSVAWEAPWTCSASTTPCVLDGVAYFGFDSQLRAYDADGGQHLWTAAAGNGAATSLLCSAEDDAVYGIFGDQTVAVSTAGQLLWSQAATHAHGDLVDGGKRVWGSGNDDVEWFMKTTGGNNHTGTGHGTNALGPTNLCGQVVQGTSVGLAAFGLTGSNTWDYPDSGDVESGPVAASTSQAWFGHLGWLGNGWQPELVSVDPCNGSQIGVAVPVDTFVRGLSVIGDTLLAFDQSGTMYGQDATTGLDAFSKTILGLGAPSRGCPAAYGDRFAVRLDGTVWVFEY